MIIGREFATKVNANIGNSDTTSIWRANSRNSILGFTTVWIQ